MATYKTGRQFYGSVGTNAQNPEGCIGAFASALRTRCLCTEWARLWASMAYQQLQTAADWLRDACMCLMHARTLAC